MGFTLRLSGTWGLLKLSMYLQCSRYQAVTIKFSTSSNINSLFLPPAISWRFTKTIYQLFWKKYRSGVVPYLQSQNLHWRYIITCISEHKGRGKFRNKEKEVSLYILLYGKPSLRQIRVFWLVLSRSGFCSTDRFRGNGPIRVFLFWSKAGKFATKTAKKKCENCHSSHWNYQQKLKRWMKLNRTGEYWPSVVFVRTERSEVRTATTSGQYSPIRPSRSVSKRLIFFLVYATSMYVSAGHRFYTGSFDSLSFQDCRWNSYLQILAALQTWSFKETLPTFTCRYWLV